MNISFVFLVLIATALIAGWWRTARALQGCDLLSDDAYYYLVTAWNFVDTGRFTFDGISETNGFHPLLFWLQAAGFALFGTGAEPMSRYLVVFITTAAVFVLTITACAWLAVRPVSSDDDAAMQCAFLITICVVLVPRFTAPYLIGMESTLVLPLLVLVGVAAWKARYVLAGVSAVLLTAARLDMLPYVVFPIGVACVLREYGRGGPAIRSGLWMLLPATTAIGLFMLFNNWYFGHPMPIHGVLKSCLPTVHLQWHQVFGRVNDNITLPAALLAAVIGACLSLRPGRVGREVRGAGLTAAVLCVVQLAAFTLFQKWSKPVPTWYLGPAVLTGTFALAAGVANMVSLRRLRTLAVAAAVCTLAVNLASVTKSYLPGRLLWAVPDTPSAAVKGRPVELIELMKSLPADQVWACTDCGKLAFWSGRAVVNLDGLINDFAYQDALRDSRLAEYLREKNVRYLVFLAWDRPQTKQRLYEPMYTHRVAPAVFSSDYEAAEFYVYSYRYMRYSDKVRLPRAAEIWRSAAAKDCNVQGKAVVFDLGRL